MTRRPFALALLLSASLALAACGGSSDRASDGAADGSSADATAPTGDTDVDEALADAAPDGEVDVPSEDGATTIADYSSGGSSYEPADPTELAQILAVVGTDADGYLTDDAIVVRTTEADIALLCGTVERLGLDAYRVVPVRPDGTGVDCAS